MKIIKLIKNNPIISFIYKYWMRFSHALGWVMSRIIFTVIYLVFIGIYAIAYMVVRKIKNINYKKQDSYWKAKKQQNSTLGSVRKQF